MLAWICSKKKILKLAPVTHFDKLNLSSLFPYFFFFFFKTWYVFFVHTFKMKDFTASVCVPEAIYGIAKFELDFF